MKPLKAKQKRSLTQAIFFQFLTLGAVVFLKSTPVMAAQFGELAIAGNGCSNKDSNLVVLSESESQYLIPLNLYIKKEEGVQFDRKSCNFALPIELAANEKLVVSDVSQKVNTRLHPTSEAKTSIEVFLSGSTTPKLTASATATTEYVNIRHTLAQEGVVFESKCGEKLILRANTNGLVTGAGKARVYHEGLKLTLKVEKCL